MAGKSLILMLVLLTISLLALVTRSEGTAAPYNNSSLPKEEEITATVVQGYVYCQNCYKEWSRHLAGAEVVVECKKANGNVIAQGKGSSDANGYFEIKLDKYSYKANYNSHTCLAKIRKSLDPECDYRTDVNHGYSGAKPVFSKVSSGVAYFTTKGFAFTPMCSY